VILIWILSVILVALCGFIIFLVLGQDVRGGGLAGALGGGSVQSAFGSRTTETVIKLTAYLLVAFFVVIIVLIRLHATHSPDARMTGGIQYTPPPAGTTVLPGTAPVDTTGSGSSTTPAPEAPKNP